MPFLKIQSMLCVKEISHVDNGVLIANVHSNMSWSILKKISAVLQNSVNGSCSALSKLNAIILSTNSWVKVMHL